MHCVINTKWAPGVVPRSLKLSPGLECLLFKDVFLTQQIRMGQKMMRYIQILGPNFHTYKYIFGKYYKSRNLQFVI